MGALRYLTAGESHGEALIGIVEGMPAGVPVTVREINDQLARRWLGFGRGGRAKIERDRVHLYSGVRFSRTIAGPVALKLINAAYKRDRAKWPQVMAVDGTGGEVSPITLPRPGHADLAGVQKYGFDDIRPVIDRASARETAMRVACCTLARLLLKQFGIEIGSHVVRIGHVGFSTSDAWRQMVDDIIEESGAEAVSKLADKSAARMLDLTLTMECKDHIRATKRQGDSLGGIYEVVVSGVPAGLGSYVHWEHRLDGRLAQAVLSIQGQKAVEIGDGFRGASTPGSSVHDPIRKEGDRYPRVTNRAGGIEGGISNGMPIILRGYMKPIPTLIRPLGTVDLATGEAQPTRYERSDVTSVPAAATVAEATVAFAIASAFLHKFGGDSLEELKAQYEASQARMRDTG